MSVSRCDGNDRHQLHRHGCFDGHRHLRQRSRLGGTANGHGVKSATGQYVRYAQLFSQDNLALEKLAASHGLAVGRIYMAVGGVVQEVVVISSLSGPLQRTTAHNQKCGVADTVVVVRTRSGFKHRPLVG